MRYSRALIPTSKEAPSDASSVSHVLLLRAGYARRVGAGIMNAVYLDEKGVQQKLVMGCYGIGISRLLAALVEQHHDADGMLFPLAVAPFQVHVVQVGSEQAVVEAVTRLEAELEQLGLEALIDDRDERPGVKFKDADLLGVPWRMTVGKKALDGGGVELNARSERDPKQLKIIPIERAAAHIFELVQQGLRATTASEAA